MNGRAYNKGELSILESAFNQNEGWFGGAIHNEGKLGIESSALISNISQLDGGAIFNSDDLNIIDSALTGNIVSSTVGSGGGAVCNFAAYSFNIENSELKDNKPDILIRLLCIIL